MNSKPLFAVLMIALLVGFGNSCICVTDPPPPHAPPADPCKDCPPQPPSGVGCQQPVYTQGLPGPDEYTVIVGVFDSEVRALGRSQKLREQRIHNYCYPQSNGCWVVSVGRYWEQGPAEKMRNVLINEFGYEKARVRKPGDKDAPCRESKQR